MKEILEKVRHISIRTKHMASESMSGAYHSAFKGQGVDFEEVREYAPGDDIRSIDWNVTAKMDKPFVKVYREERELTLILCVDLSASGEFASQKQSKRELAAEVASILAFSAIQNNDKLGLLLFTEDIEHYLPARKGRQHVMRVVRDILYYQPQRRRTDLPQALRHLNRIQKRKALIFLISDFLQDSQGQALFTADNESTETLKILKQTNRRHDLVCLSVSDPREEVLPNVGVVTLEDPESGQQITLDTSKASVRDSFRSLSQKRQESLLRACRSSAIDLLSLHTGQDYLSTLQSFMQARAHLR